MNEILKIKNITKDYGIKGFKTRVLKDISLNINKGDFIAIMGPSGAGKTTLLNIMSTLDKQTSGDVILDGIDVSKVKNKELSKLRREKIGFIFQDYNLLDNMTLMNNIALPLALGKKKSKEIEDRVINIAKKFGLENHLDKYPYQLSGGMARRVLVSTALLSEPKLVVADEPTPGLDEKTVQETLNHFKQMKKDGIGVLLITHDIHAALEVADRIGIFYSGYVIEIAENKDFSGDGENLLHPYTKALYKALPKNGFELIKGHQPLHGEIQQGCPYYDRCEMKFDRCKDERPELIDLGNKKVRCFKYEEEA